MSRPTSLLKSRMFKQIVGGTIAALTAGILLQAVPRQPIVVGLVCVVLVIVAVFIYYVDQYGKILSYRDSPKDSMARDAYNRIRSSLRSINKLGDTPFGTRYRGAITSKLHGVERWVGDAGYPNSERLCCKLNLDYVRPLWTPESFDRCLLLAFLYPFLSLKLVWVVSESIGPAERALGLQEFVGTPFRFAFGFGLLFAALSVRRFNQSKGIKSFLRILIKIFIIVVAAVASIIPIAIVVGGSDSDFGDFAASIVVSVVLAALIAGSVLTLYVYATVVAKTGAGSGASVVAIGAAVAVKSAGVDATVILFAVAISGAVLNIVLRFLYWILGGTARHPRIIYYVLFSVLMIIGFFVSPALLSDSENWNSGLLLLFFGVLVFVNAPLDWLTLGITRTLMWRGVDRRGLYPFVYGILDIIIAIFLLVVLSMVMVLGVQLFNAAAVFGISDATDPAIIDAAVSLYPADLVAGMANQATRGNPEYWWVYITLFSTLLPSWLHLLVASGCFVRGSKRLNKLITEELPLGKEGEPLLPHIETKLALLLAGQRTGGIALATMVFFGGLYIVFFVLPPHILPRLLDLAVPLAESDWATGFVETIAYIIGSR